MCVCVRVSSAGLFHSSFPPRSLPPAPPPLSSLRLAADSRMHAAVNGRVLCGCDVVSLWSVCTATVVQTAYQPAASSCLGLPTARRTAGWLLGCLAAWQVVCLTYMTDCCVIKEVEAARACACTNTHTHAPPPPPQTSHKLSLCVTGDTGQPSASRDGSVPSLVFPIV